MVAVPRRESGVQSSPVEVQPIPTPAGPDFSSFHLTQAPWFPASVRRAILQPPTNSERPKLLPINPISIWVPKRQFPVICNPRILTSTRWGEEGVPDVSFQEKNLHSSLLKWGHPDLNRKGAQERVFSLQPQELRVRAARLGLGSGTKRVWPHAVNLESYHLVPAVYSEIMQAIKITCRMWEFILHKTPGHLIFT